MDLLRSPAALAARGPLRRLVSPAEAPPPFSLSRRVHGGTTSIQLCGRVEIDIHHEQRYASCRWLRPPGRDAGFDFDLARPWATTLCLGRLNAPATVWSGITRDGSQASDVFAAPSRMARLAYRAALGLDPDLLLLAQRSRIDLDAAGFTASHLNMVWQRRPQFETVARETPSLLPLVAAACQRGLIGKGQDAVAQVKRLARAHGWSQRFWRLVCHGSRQLLRPALVMRGSSSPWQAMMTYGSALDRSGIDFEPPASAALAYLQTVTDPEACPHAFEREDWVRWTHGDVLRLALEECRWRGADRARFLDDEFRLAIQWGAVNSTMVLNRDQRAAGWRWIERRTREFFTRRRLTRLPLETWRSCLQGMRVAGVDVRPLTDGAAVVAEGLEMRHCLSVRQDYVDRCMRNLSRLFAIDAPHRSTLALTRDRDGQPFVVEAVRGPCNRPPTSDQRQLAELVCSAYNQAERSGHPTGVPLSGLSLLHRNGPADETSWPALSACPTGCSARP